MCALEGKHVLKQNTSWISFFTGFFVCLVLSEIKLDFSQVTLPIKEVNLGYLFDSSLYQKV